MLKSIKLYGLFTVAMVLGACVGNVTYKSASFDGFMKPEKVSGVMSKPDGKGPFAAVVILHSSAGLTDNTIISWPGYLNGLGYVTLSPDTQGSRGVSWRDWNLFQQTADAYGALDFLGNLSFVDGNRVAVIGFSAGGRTVNDRIYDNPDRSDNGLSFKAAISFYGDCALIDFKKKNALPLMMLVGDHEPDHRLSDCLVDHPGTEVEVHIFKDAYHSFDNENVRSLRYSRVGGNPILYNHAARKKSEELVKAFLAKHLGK